MFWGNLPNTDQCKSDKSMIIVANHSHFWWACENNSQSVVFKNLLNSVCGKLMVLEPTGGLKSALFDNVTVSGPKTSDEAADSLESVNIELWDERHNPVIKFTEYFYKSVCHIFRNIALGKLRHLLCWVTRRINYE